MSHIHICVHNNAIQVWQSQTCFYILSLSVSNYKVINLQATQRHSFFTNFYIVSYSTNYVKQKASMFHSRGYDRIFFFWKWTLYQRFDVNKILLRVQPLCQPFLTQPIFPISIFADYPKQQLPILFRLCRTYFNSMLSL